MNKQKTQYPMQPHDPRTFRRYLRQHATKAEQLLWQELRDRKLCGHKFRRQHSIETYVVDFFCFEQKLVIELDGASHESLTARSHDLVRQEYLENNGYRVIRFWNSEVEQNMDEVLLKISSYL